MKRRFALFLSLIMLTGCGGSTADVSSTNNTAAANTKTTQNIYSEDAWQLVYAVEAAHPAFIMEGMLPDGYEAAKARFLETSENAESLDDFEVAVNIYLNSIKDIHTCISKLATEENESTLRNMYRYELDIKYIEQDGKLLLANEDHESTGAEIISVGGIEPKDIFKTIDDMFPIENNIAESYYRRNYSLSREILRLSGCNVSGDAIEVVCSDETRQVPFTDLSEDTSEPAYEIKTADIKKINDIMYVNISSFKTKDDNYIKALEQIQEFAENGGGKVIIDLRNNSGGMLLFLKETVRAFDMNIPVGKIVTRHSRDEWETVKKDPKAALDDKTFSEYPSTLSTIRPNPNVDMVVLCNANSLSASVDMCAGIQDGKLGTVIGITPRNSPSFFMDPLKFELPNTKIETAISGSYEYRADETADQKVFTPDIVLDLKYSRGEEMIKYAVEEYFHEEYIQ